jgi:hypothetical protein
MWETSPSRIMGQPFGIFAPLAKDRPVWPHSHDSSIEIREDMLAVDGSGDMPVR